MSTEISGKIVLLSRGGCGFLEKVQWAQRRGSIAVIVGDNIPGRALVTMFARGDTSNITIPAVFTTHTTAQFLSSLIPFGGLPCSVSGCGNIEREISVETNQQQSQLATGQLRDRVEKDSQNSHYISKGLNTMQQKPHFRKDLESESFLVFLKRIGVLLLRDLGVAKVQKVVHHQNCHAQSNKDINLVKPDSHNQRENLQDAKMFRAVSTKTSVARTDNFEVGIEEWKDPNVVEHISNPATPTACLDEYVVPEIKTQHQGSINSHNSRSNTPDSGTYKNGNTDRGDQQARNYDSYWKGHDDSAAGKS